MKSLLASCLILLTTAAFAADTSGPVSPHGLGGKVLSPVDLGKIKVDKAVGANARTVAEIVAKRLELKDQPVLVRGKVVKFNPQIMGKNWVHLRDGSGSAADGSNDILVTTQAATKVGDIVTVSGTVRTDQDFGSGYSYQVLIEEATLKP